MPHRESLRASFVTVTVSALLGAGCNGEPTYNPPGPALDVPMSDVATTDTPPALDISNPPQLDVTPTDTTPPSDRSAPDAPADTPADASTDAPPDTSADASADAPTDASQCPTTTPTPGEHCPSDPPSLTCHYGNCLGSPTITAACQSGVWAVSIRSCNPPFDAGSDR